MKLQNNRVVSVHGCWHICGSCWFWGGAWQSTLHPTSGLQGSTDHRIGALYRENPPQLDSLLHQSLGSLQPVWVYLWQVKRTATHSPLRHVLHAALRVG